MVILQASMQKTIQAQKLSTSVFSKLSCQENLQFYFTLSLLLLLKREKQQLNNSICLVWICLEEVF